MRNALKIRLMCIIRPKSFSKSGTERATIPAPRSYRVLRLSPEFQLTRISPKVPVLKTTLSNKRRRGKRASPQTNP
jgi:hypothetical protein